MRYEVLVPSSPKGMGTGTGIGTGLVGVIGLPGTGTGIDTAAGTVEFFVILSLLKATACWVYGCGG